MKIMTSLKDVLRTPGGKVAVALIIAALLVAVIVALSTLLLLHAPSAKGAVDLITPGALLAAVITAISALLVATITQYLTRLSEDRTKRIQLTIEHAEKQLSEFYSPLVALALRLDQAAVGSADVVPYATAAERPDVDRIMWEDIYSPIHQEIIFILKTKSYLIEGFDIESAEGFIAYLHHYESQRIYWQLAAKNHIIANAKIPAYPPLFNDDIRKGLFIVTSRYENSLQELRGRTLHHR
jgi:hypothetical protein